MLKEKKPTKTPDFVDAQDMAVQYPTTFWAPTLAELQAAIKPGCVIKVAAADERFWVKVTEVGLDKASGDPVFIGKVDNDLISTDGHGLKLGDVVRVSWRHIYGYDGPAS